MRFSSCTSCLIDLVTSNTGSTAADASDIDRVLPEKFVTLTIVSSELSLARSSAKM